MSTPPAELPLALPSTESRASSAAEQSSAMLTRERYGRVARRVKLLSWLSLAWMSVEGGVAITAGILAGSIALVGFGLDSFIEGLASLIIVWRFTGHRLFSAQAEGAGLTAPHERSAQSHPVALRLPGGSTSAAAPTPHAGASVETHMG